MATGLVDLLRAPLVRGMVIYSRPLVGYSPTGYSAVDINRDTVMRKTFAAICRLLLPAGFIAPTTLLPLVSFIRGPWQSQGVSALGIRNTAPGRSLDRYITIIRHLVDINQHILLTSINKRNIMVDKKTQYDKR